MRGRWGHPGNILGSRHMDQRARHTEHWCQVSQGTECDKLAGHGAPLAQAARVLLLGHYSGTNSRQREWRLGVEGEGGTCGLEPCGVERGRGERPETRSDQREPPSSPGHRLQQTPPATDVCARGRNTQAPGCRSARWTREAVLPKACTHTHRGSACAQGTRMLRREHVVHS